MKFTKLDYCQYLLSSQINYTITNLAEHLENISHDQINYYLKKEKLTPRLLWDNVKEMFLDITEKQKPFQVVTYGSTNYGKTWTAVLVIFYTIIFTNHLRSPGVYYGLNDISEITIYILSFKYI